MTIEERKEKEMIILRNEISVLEDRKENLENEIQDKKAAYRKLCFSPHVYFELIDQEV